MAHIEMVICIAIGAGRLMGVTVDLNDLQNPCTQSGYDQDTSGEYCHQVFRAHAGLLWLLTSAEQLEMIRDHGNIRRGREGKNRGSHHNPHPPMSAYASCDGT